MFNRKNWFVAIMLVVLFFTSSSVNAQELVKKAIVVASFGTTYDEARKLNIESIEQDIKNAFPEYDHYRAFTSRIVMKRLAERGIVVDDLKTALDKLEDAGYTEVVVQPTLVTPEEEFDNKIMRVVNKYNSEQAFDKLLVGRPLLTTQGDNGTVNDFAVLTKALEGQLPAKMAANEAVVFMGHGSPNRHNVAYRLLQDQMVAEKKQIAIGVVEETDYPNFNDTLGYIKTKGYKKITLMPLMIVAGDHARNDMAGDEPDSWKNMLQKEGFEVKVYMKGMGENPNVRSIFVQHVRDAIQGK